MDPKILIVVLVIVAIIVIAAIVMMQRRKTALRERFGPEYERTVRERGSEREAQAVLAEREKRVSRFKMRDLSESERQQYAEHWRRVQARFVDDPRGAVTDADESVGLLMGARGYPMTDFDQRAADLSVDHPRVVENYRAAHGIALRHREGRASTEDLRQAMIHYRSLFEDLLDGHKPGEVRNREVA
jgi:hypothetical protein